MGLERQKDLKEVTMRKVLLSVAVLLGVGLSGCAVTEFQAYEGRTNTFEGRGGTKVVVDGMEIWEGDPPQRFTVLGVLKDERPGGPLPMGMLRGDMVKQARARGGDALINLGGASTYVGSVGTGFAQANTFGGQTSATGFGTSVAMRRSTSSYAVIRYEAK